MINKMEYTITIIGEQLNPGATSEIFSYLEYNNLFYAHEIPFQVFRSRRVRTSIQDIIIVKNIYDIYSQSVRIIVRNRISPVFFTLWLPISLGM